MKRITKKARRKFIPATLHLYDELPRIGTGHRHVLVRDIQGSKVRVLYGNERHTIPLKTFEAACIQPTLSEIRTLLEEGKSKCR